MKHRSRIQTLLLFALIFGGQSLPAFQHPAQAELPDLDMRRSTTPPTNTLSAAHEAGVQRLKARIADLQIGRDEFLRRPRFVSRRNGFLTGTNGSGGVISSTALKSLPAGEPHRIVKAFLDEHASVFGHDSSALTNAVIARDYVTKHNGLRTTVWEQRLEGVPIFESTVQAQVTQRGELVNISSRFVSGPAKAVGSRKPQLSATRAEALAAESLGVAGQMAADPAPKLIWLPMDAATLQLCWDVTLTMKSRGETFRLLVDAETGEVLFRRCMTVYLSNATYNVFTSDSPSPFSPGWSTVNTNQPALISRSLVTIPALDTNASPNGWINDGSNTTVGNNVDAHTDRNGDNIADPGSQPTGSPNRVFNFPLDLTTQDPTNYSPAAVVNLFYWCNWMHDRLYELGFDEAAGNFQTDNFGRGGAGGDALQADGQDSGANNSNMTTPSEGSPPRMQMYLWFGTSGPNPRRDGDLDAEIILHEYTHGLSWRLVGGGLGIGALQTSGMGEGWSDFYALALLSDPGDNVNGNYAFGGYAGYRFSGSTQNYYFGVRRYPYSTDLLKNPLTLADITSQLPHTGIPRNPNYTTPSQLNPAEVHNQGEIWCSALWDARALLLAKYGFTNGSQIILRLVTDGMKLCPPEPTFLEARDAILSADNVNNGGANKSELWQAFAKRGMGVSAIAPPSYMTAGMIEAYDADVLTILPMATIGFSGPAGGPFAQSATSILLTNTSASPISWLATHAMPWLTITTGGSLNGNSATNIIFALNANATALAVGAYTDTVVLSNEVTGIWQPRTVTLDVLPGRRVYFYALDTDPGWTRAGQWAFGHPTGGGGGYGYPDPTNGMSGTNVFGVNLNGNYTTGVAGPFYLTCGPLNFNGFTNTSLLFSRWLNSDYQTLAYATTDVSSNGTTWTQIWNNGGSAISDNAWGNHHYDISAISDNRATVYVRWGYQTRTGVYPYSGWNIDDVEFLAVPGPVIPTNQMLGFHHDSAAGLLTFSWPSYVSGFSLQENTNLVSTNWLITTNAVNIVGTNFEVNIPITSGTHFFRLMHP